MRAILTRLHRTLGLAIAVFLALAGLSGSIIVFYQELDRSLNPELFQVPVSAETLSPSHLAERVEQQLPGAHVTLMTLSMPKDRAAELWVLPAAGTLPYDQVFADPSSGRVLGKRAWGKFELSRAAAMPVLYLFHYTLKLPGFLGVYLMGIIGCIWAIDCFVAFALTLPRGAPFWKKWKPSWRIKYAASPFRLQFDLHRAGGLWLWAILLILATSGVALNLPDQVFRPVVGMFATLSPTLDELRPHLAKVHAPRLSFDDALKLARQEAHTESFAPRFIFHAAEHGVYGVGYGAHGDKGMGGWGLSYLYFDDRTGAIALRQPAGEGRASDIYAGMQYQLHSGRVLGWPGRILVCLTGLAVTMLSITGVYIWLRKRRARIAKRKWASGATATPVKIGN
jgi:uncharacterized iron-regulated membrane protein